MVAGYVPERGDVVWLHFDPQAGHEQAGLRPGLVLSPAEYNQKTSLALICPITSRSKRYPFLVSLPEGLPIQGTVIADQIRSLDWRAREARLACHAPDDVVEEALEKLGTLLGFDGELNCR